MDTANSARFPQRARRIDALMRVSLESNRFSSTNYYTIKHHMTQAQGAWALQCECVCGFIRFRKWKHVASMGTVDVNSILFVFVSFPRPSCDLTGMAQDSRGAPASPRPVPREGCSRHFFSAPFHRTAFGRLGRHQRGCGPAGMQRSELFVVSQDSDAIPPPHDIMCTSCGPCLVGTASACPTAFDTDYQSPTTGPENLIYLSSCERVAVQRVAVQRVAVQRPLTHQYFIVQLPLTHQCFIVPCSGL
jgi:hypothetical protein